MTARVYGYADVGRYGLGHSLLAWARCVVWCRERNIPLIAPIWFRPRLGPYIRQEKDKREYFRLFHSGDDTAGIRRIWLLLISRKITQGAMDWPELQSLVGNSIVVFRNSYARNFERNFDEVRGNSQLLHMELLRITKPQYHPRHYTNRPFIAIHVRQGDFQNFDPAAVAKGEHNRQLPLEWYCEVLDALRTQLGTCARAIVFSDGADSALAHLLAREQIELAPHGSAVTHMLEMSCASAIISAGSGFSLWSAFFGQIPRITHPGQSIVQVLDNKDLETQASKQPVFTTALLSEIASRLTLKTATA